MNVKEFLIETNYIDFSTPLIIEKAQQLFEGINSDIEKYKIAYEYVRDDISHSFDVNSDMIVAKASDVLKYKNGICHAKANLLVALLRSQKIPAGFCFQHITIATDDSLGYCIHCYNAIFVDNHWIKVDARGNKNGKNAQFSLGKPLLAFPNRKEYDEYFWDGIYANPHLDTMKMLEKATTRQEVMDNLPDYVVDEPDIV